MALTRQQAEEVRQKVAAGATRTAVGKEYGVSQSAISAIVLNKVHVRVFYTPEEYRERARRGRFRSRFGISWEDFEKMLEDAGYACEACGERLEDQKGHRDTGNPFLIHDHNHATGASRGVLCNHCNLALGHAKDSIERLEALITYLRKKAI